MIKQSLAFLVSLALIGSIQAAEAISTSVSGSEANALGIGIIDKSQGGSAGASVEQVFNSQGSAIPVTLPGIPGVGIPSPQVFNFGPLSNPTNINAITPSLYFQKKCQQEYSGPNDTYTAIMTGSSGKTDLSFTSYPDYQKGAASQTRIAKVIPRFPAQAGEYVCLGIVMTTASKGSEGKVNINTVLDDTVKFAFSLEGYSEVYVISPEQSIGTALGVDTGGSGFSLGLAAAGLVGSANPALGTVLGLASAFSKTNASTHPDGRIGATYWVLGKPNGTAGIPFSEAEFGAFFVKMMKGPVAAEPQPSPVATNGGNGGKKLEATKH